MRTIGTTVAWRVGQSAMVIGDGIGKGVIRIQLVVDIDLGLWQDVRRNWHCEVATGAWTQVSVVQFHLHYFHELYLCCQLLYFFLLGV